MPAMGRAASIVAESADGTLQKLPAGRTGSGRAWTVSPPHPPRHLARAHGDSTSRPPPRPRNSDSAMQSRQSRTSGHGSSIRL
jgi:hypothetical protein